MKTRTEEEALKQLKNEPWMYLLYTLRKWLSYGCSITMGVLAVHRGWGFWDVVVMMLVIVLAVSSAFVHGAVVGFTCDSEEATNDPISPAPQPQPPTTKN